MARLDGKYEILRSVPGSSGLPLPSGSLSVSDFNVSESQDPQGAPVLIVQLSVQTSEQRTLFHKYRAALKALPSPFLLDVVARPGAYYSVWKPPTGPTLEEYLKGPRKNTGSSEAVRSFAQSLSEAGFALEDADVHLEGGLPVLAGLVPIERSSEDIEMLNAEVLKALQGGKTSGRARRAPRGAEKAKGAGVKVPRAGRVGRGPDSRLARTARFLLSVLPGTLLLAGAGYWGARALDVYLNPKVLTVPKVLGLSGQDAALKLRDSGFRVSIVQGEERSLKIGSIIGQDPAPDSALHGGRLVTLTVNNPPPLSVPKVSELSLDSARGVLRDAGLKVGVVRYTFTADLALPKGEVVGQSPETGTQVARGGTVDVLISQGVRPQQTFLPDLTGLSFAEAKAMVKQSLLVLNDVAVQDSDQPEGTVLAQNPAPYAKLRVGMPARLVVARVPQAAPPPRANLDTLPLGQIVKHVPPPPPEPVVTPAVPAVPTPVPTPDSSTPVPVPVPTPTPNSSTPATPTPQAPTPATGTPPSGNSSTPSGAPAPDILPTPAPDPATTLNTATPNAGTPSSPVTPSPATSSSTGRRSLNFVYTFPADLPSGSAVLRVRDAGGEQILITQSGAAGLSVQLDVQVTGAATFVVTVDGQQYDTFVR